MCRPNTDNHCGSRCRGTSTDYLGHRCRRLQVRQDEKAFRTVNIIFCVFQFISHQNERLVISNQKHVDSLAYNNIIKTGEQSGGRTFPSQPHERYRIMSLIFICRVDSVAELIAICSIWCLMNCEVEVYE